MLLRSIVTVLALLAALPAMAAPYTLDNGGTKLGFSVLYASLMRVPGSFGRFKGSLDFEPETGKLGAVKVEVETASINTGIAPRDKHLRAEDFFNAEAFPKALFTLEGGTLKKGVPELLPGKLTIRGVQKPVDVTVVWKDESGTAKADGPSFLLEAEIDRRDFGVSYGPNFLISDKVKLSIPGTAMPVK